MRVSWSLKGFVAVCALALPVAPASAAEQVTRTPLAAGDAAQALEAGADGRVWATLGDRLAVIGPGRASRVFAVAAGTAGHAIATGPDGAFWTGGENGSAVSRTTTTGATATVALPSHLLRTFADAVRGPDGSMWFGGDAGLVRVRPDGGVETYEVTDPGRPAGDPTPVYKWPTPPLRLAAGPDGAIWFVGNRDVIGRFTPEAGYTGVTIEHDPSEPIEAGGIAAGPDGALWVAIRHERELVRLTPDGAMTRVALRGPADGAIEAVGRVLWVAMQHPSEPGRHYLARVEPGAGIRYVEVGAELVRLAGGPGGVVFGIDEEGRSVVRVGQEPTRCVVPRLRGLSLATARKRLAAAHCRLGRVRGSRRRGAHIASQSPRPGAVRGARAKVGVRVR